MTSALSDLGLTIPLLAAPMAGGPSTPELVLAAASAGGMGFLAGGYQTPEALSEQIAVVSASAAMFGVNLFAPNPLPVDRIAYARYRGEITDDADRFRADLPELPIEDDDSWHDKIDLLVANPVPIVSFTFGIPERAALDALRGVGSILVQTVTSAGEARQAADAGVDALAVQSSAAGGHSGTLNPARISDAIPMRQLLNAVGAAVDLPLIAAGGIVDARQVAEAISGSARAVMVGTALLLADESGISPPYRAALQSRGRGDTVVTRAFSGRPARALRNRFIDAHDADAPAGYPAIHYLTSPMRRASAAAGNAEYISLWAGMGYRSITAQPAGLILQELAARL